MIWHIFKKDFRLLWRLAVGVNLIHFVAVIGMFRFGHFGDQPTLGPALLQLFQLLAFLGTGFLIIASVHQDAIPGVRQDWLVRPVQRRDLLLAKLLFMLVAAQVPIFLADLVEGLAAGFSLNQSPAAAISRSAYLLISFDLPILMLASLTRNFTEAVIGCLLTFAGYVSFQLLFLGLGHGAGLVLGIGGPANGGIAWITELLELLLILLGASAVLGLQFYRRRTRVARWLTVGIALLCLLTQDLPWQSAFAMEQSLSKSPAAGKEISAAFDPGIGKFQRPSGVNIEATRAALQAGYITLSLPLHFSGLPTDVVLKADHSAVGVVTSLGKRENIVFKSVDFDIPKEGPGDNEAHIWQTIFIPSSAYNRIKDLPVRLEINYSLTLLTLSNSHAMGALNGDQRMAGLGWCKTRMNDSETDVLLRCLNVGNGPSCATAFLEYIPNGHRNPETSSCQADYTPFFRGSLTSDSLTRFGTELPFRDPSKLAHYPVDGAKLAESQVVVRTYSPVDHFTRRLVIPKIRLKDWQAQ